MPFSPMDHFHERQLVRLLQSKRNRVQYGTCGRIPVMTVPTTKTGGSLVLGIWSN